MLKSGENGLIGPGDNDYGRKERKPELVIKSPRMPDIPRRIRLDMNTPAEIAIYNAIQEIEKLGADVRLTNAQTLLQQAKDLVGDYIDEKWKGMS